MRNLERVIASLYRKAAKKLVAGEAKRVTVRVKQLEPMLGPKRFKDEQGYKKDEVGLVNGLAWTSGRRRDHAHRGSGHGRQRKD